MNPEHRLVSGLSGNEIYCLSKLGMRPGQLCIGNSVVSIGFFGGLGAGLSTLGGGEVTEVTQLVHDGRKRSLERMIQEAQVYNGVGIAGVSFDMVKHGGNLEFITIGSTVHSDQNHEQLKFSTSADVQQLYCQMDSGFQPFRFVFGNVAYSIGIGGSIKGAFRQLTRGEVPEYTEIFDRTRHLALNRLIDEAKSCGANSVIGIETTVAPLLGTQEMVMIGTASYHPSLTQYANEPVTSDMTNEEMWNMVHLGYLPIRLVMGVSVYSLGLKAGIISGLQSLGGGEVRGLTELLYEAREKALLRIEQEAERYGADQVVGVKTRVYDLGQGMVEFMAIGTAVKKIAGAKTKSDTLPPQAIIQDRETFVDSTNGINLNTTKAASARLAQGGPMGIIAAVMVVIFYIIKMLILH